MLYFHSDSTASFNIYFYQNGHLRECLQVEDNLGKQILTPYSARDLCETRFGFEPDRIVIEIEVQAP